MTSTRRAPTLTLAVALSLTLAVALVGCGKKEEATPTDTTVEISEVTITAPPTTATSSSAPSVPGPTVVAPDELGTPGPAGMEYPTPTTCSQVSTLLASGNVNPSAGGALAQGSGIWLAIDSTTTSADVFFQKSGSDRTLVKLRAGVITFNGAPSDAQLPALTPISYATAEVTSGLAVASCVEGAVVD